MGAMACFRCDRAMCDLYSEEFGYICYDCFKELKRYCKLKRDCSPDTIRTFMKSYSSTKVFDPDDGLEERIEEYLDTVFR
jgi:hypothetical protein